MQLSVGQAARYYNETNLTFPTLGREREYLEKFLYCEGRRAETVYGLAEVRKFVRELRETTLPVLDEGRCLIGNVLALDRHLYEDEDTIFEIAETLRDLTKLGDTTTADVFTFGVVGDPETAPLILKSSVLQRESVLHEAFVGLDVTNDFRAEIPNFAYVFGYFQCSPPISDGKRVVNWCTRRGSASYTLYERVPGEDMYQALEDISPQNYLDYYMQILYALWGVRERFSHMDLKPDNIVLRPLGKVMVMEYEVEGEKRYVRSDHAATIIDYGSSTAVYGGDIYSGFSRTTTGGPVSLNIGHDLFKLAFYSMIDSPTEELKGLTKAIADYFLNFTEADYDTVLAAYGALPPQDWDLFDFEEHLASVAEEFSLTFDYLNPSSRPKLVPRSLSVESILAPKQDLVGLRKSLTDLERELGREMLILPTPYPDPEQSLLANHDILLKASDLAARLSQYSHLAVNYEQLTNSEVSGLDESRISDYLGQIKQFLDTLVRTLTHAGALKRAREAEDLAESIRPLLYG